MALQVASLFAAIGADVSGLHAGLADASDALSHFGDKIAKIGKKLTVGVTLPILALGGVAAKMAGDFEQGIALLGIAMDRAEGDMASVSDYALQMGADTIFGAQEMVAAMTGLAKAGQSWEQIAGDMTGTTGTLAATTNLAAGSSLELADAADAISVAMATFGLKTEDATWIADSFVKTADASVAEVQHLVDAMRTFGPVAASYGFSLQDVNTALAILSQRGIVGAQAGTALRSMFTNMMRDVDGVTDLWTDLGISMFDASGNMRDFPAIMADLGEAMAGMTQEQSLATIQTLSGTYGMVAMNAELAEGAVGWAAMEEAISGAATAQEVADAKMSGLNGSMEQLSGSLETLGIKVGMVLTPALVKIIDESLIPMIDKVAELDPAILELGIKFALLLAAVGPVVFVIGKLMTLFGAIGTALPYVVSILGSLGGVGGVFAAMLSPIGLLVGAFVALVAAVVIFGKDAAAALVTIAQGFQAIFDYIWVLIKRFAGRLVVAGKDLVMSLASGVRAAAGDLIDAITGAVGDAIGAARRLLRSGSPSKVFMEIGQNITAGLAQGITGTKDRASSAVQTVTQAMTAAPSMALAASPMGGGGGGGGGNLIVQINAPITVRDDRDIDRIANTIAERTQWRGGFRTPYRPAAA